MKRIASFLIQLVAYAATAAVFYALFFRSQF
jgi:hypothetical protein